MTDDRLRQLYARGIQAGGVQQGRRDECGVAPETLLALAEGELPEGELPEDERLALFDRVMACEACRQEFALLRAVVVSGREHRPLEGGRAAQPPRLAAPPRWRRLAVPVALAASLVLVVGVGRFLQPGGEPPVMRGGADGVALLAPSADAVVSRAVSFAWRPVAGAERYSFELLDTDGTPAYETTTTDTTVALPATVVLRPGAQYRWLVRATDGAGGERGSAVRRLRVRGE